MNDTDSTQGVQKRAVAAVGPAGLILNATHGAGSMGLLGLISLAVAGIVQRCRYRL